MSRGYSELSGRGAYALYMSPEELGTVVLLTGLGSLVVGERMEGLEPQVLPPGLACPSLPSLGPGVPMCKTGSQDELVCGSLPAPTCRDFGPGDREVIVAWSQLTLEDAV